MSKITIPAGYRMPLTNNELQRAIELIHAEFQHNLTVRLNLHRVSAPLFVDGATGLNDDLNGVERPAASTSPTWGPTARWSTPWPSGSGWPSSAMSSSPARAFTPI